ncbi:MAG: TonB-dependent receptor [Kangiellaceae bacterium]|nr:TonB-dependent receptor [Kangiellaceae bacterium]
MKINTLSKISLAMLSNAMLTIPLLAAVSDDDNNQEENVITVTAQKREQKAIEVPMSIAVITAEDIEQKGIANLQDLSFSVPGMSMREDGPGSYTVFMRGLSNTSSSGALVGMYLDELPSTISGYDQLDLRLIDLQRVEVLKGPQGTLYGSGSIAGTVKYITNSPDTQSFEGSIGASYSQVSDGEAKKTVTGVINVPIVEDVFAVRIAATMERDGGWQDQPEAGIKDGNYQDLEHARLKALWQINGSLSAEATYITHSNESRLGLGFEEADRTVEVAIDPSIELLPKEMDYDLYGLTVDYSGEEFNLVSITSSVDYTHQYPFTYFGTEQTIYAGFLEGNDERYQEADQFTQELRMSSADTGNPLHWTVGYYYRDVDNQLDAISDTLFAGVVYPDAPFSEKQSSKSTAYFADVSYEVTDSLELGLGARQFDDEKEVIDNLTGVTKEKDFDSLTFRFYGSYALTEYSHIYANVGEGFRSGGFNEPGRSDYEPEEVTNYEIGTKGVFFDGVLSLETAYYHTKYDEMIRRGLIFDAATSSFEFLLSNIGTVEVDGLEFGANINATDNLSFSITASFIDSEVIKINSEDSVNIAGDDVDYVPKTAYTLGAKYNFLLSGLPGYARIDYSYRDKVSYVDRSSFPAENATNQFSDDLSLIDARVGIEMDDISIELFATNLTDENKYIDPYAGWKNANRTRPRSIGVKAEYSF